MEQKRFFYILYCLVIFAIPEMAMAQQDSSKVKKYFDAKDYLLQDRYIPEGKKLDKNAKGRNFSIGGFVGLSKLQGAASVSPTCGLGAADETPSCEMRARLASARSPALSGSRGSTNSNPPLVRDPPGSSNPPHDPLRSSRVWLLRFPSSLSDSDRTRVMGSGNRSVSMHQSTRS